MVHFCVCLIIKVDLAILFFFPRCWLMLRLCLSRVAGTASLTKH